MKDATRESLIRVMQLGRECSLAAMERGFNNQEVIYLVASLYVSLELSSPNSRALAIDFARAVDVLRPYVVDEET